jgi:hypothetical protein
MSLKKKLAFLLPLLAILFALPSQAQTCIKFEAPAFPLGTTYGAPVGQVSGDLAFSFNLIDAYVFNFHTFGPGIAFNRAYIDNAPVAFSPGQSLRLNNISLELDLRNLGFTVRRVTFAYLDLGGYENLAINGSLYVGEITSAPAVLGGANVAVSSTPLPPPRSGKTGTVTITGNIVKSVRIGGQELWIDSVCAQ